MGGFGEGGGGAEGFEGGEDAGEVFFWGYGGGVRAR